MHDRRADTRALLTHTPALVIDREGLRSFEATVSDFSQAGCSVTSPRVLEFPVEVGLQIRGFEEIIPGRVVWRQRNRAGIEFARADQAGDDRSDTASTISIAATACNLTGGLRVRCTIEEATRTTCRIASDQIDRLHDDIVIRIKARKVAIRGRIMWRAGDCAGVRLMWKTAGKGTRRPISVADVPPSGAVLHG
jgi:hypothetical protein